jgi:putative selenate reductase
MSDEMRVQPFDVLLRWVLDELEQNDSIFNIPRPLFYTPEPDSAYAVDDLFGHRLSTPVGPGAGPHTQLTQNIIASWLSGGRFIELKTVQIMDELDIPRPCIDMADEGYNVEWSQELKLRQSADEYVKAWVLVHILRHVLGFEETPFGTIFNMSVGYDLEGIQSDPITHFMDQMDDASEQLDAIEAILQRDFPQLADIEIPRQLSDNVTLSTMHGCPPDEIEQICQYLMEERGLHTVVKLNPTLLGKATVMEILHQRLGFTGIDIPDRIFEHDLQYDRAVEMIRTLKGVAADQGLTFGVKLSNTLAMANHRDVLPGDEMYMSGRALYPITMNLFHKLVQEFEGDLYVSYSAGADALNVADILAAGALPVTTVSDLLKPGGPPRMVQYLETLAQRMEDVGAERLADLAQARLVNLERAATEALEDPRYKKAYHPFDLPKVETGLELFDCIDAPCVAQCAVRQDVPEYAWLICQGAYDEALRVILHRNPLPNVTGYVCDHLCQTRCTRNNYEGPVRIRDLKRFAAEHGCTTLAAAPPTGRKVAIVGSGPAGLAAAYFLALNGVEPTIFEARDRPGGMLAIAPVFRLPEAVVAADMERIEELGAEIKLNHRVTAPPEEILEQGFDAVFVGPGAQQDAELGIPGEEGEGVTHALRFLERVRSGDPPTLRGDVLVIGGGNSAMDAARTAKRLTDGEVTVVYRRTEAQMPADTEEIEDIKIEGIELEELASPTRFVLGDGAVVALECVRNELGPVGADGRRKPVPIEESNFEIPANTVIVAIGQRTDVAFLDGSTISLQRDGTVAADPETGQAGEGPLYAGGDVVRGPETIIKACADGRHAAEAICHRLELPFQVPPAPFPTLTEEEIVRMKQGRAHRVPPQKTAALPAEAREGFDLVEATLSEAAAQAEAARCVQCSSFCDKCVEVCPNRANFTYHVEPVHVALPTLVYEDGELTTTEETLFTVEQTRQILHVEDFCNECGNCTTFCVHQGDPYRDKPRLFLNQADFEARLDDAFRILKREGGWVIQRRVDGETHQLSLSDGSMVFEDEGVRVTLSPALEIESMELKAPFAGTRSLVEAGEMAVILKGVTASLSFLPFPH